MNLFLFCLHLAVPSTFRPKLPPERGLRSGFKRLSAAFASNVRSTSSALTPAARSWSLMRCLVRPRSKPNDREGCLQGDRDLPTNSWPREDSCVVSEGHDRIYKQFRVNERGARDRSRPSSIVVMPASPLLCGPPPLSPSPPRACIWPGSGMAFDLAEKIDRQLRRAVRTRGDDMSLTQGYLAMFCSP